MNDSATTGYNSENAWTDFYRSKKPGGKTYPNEGVVKIFMGSFPDFQFDKSRYGQQRVCDVGCGDGRNLVLLKNLGFETYGVEITEGIVQATKTRLQHVEGMDIDIRVGKNDQLPFENGYFDYLLSWHACYYMGDHDDFDLYTREFARVLKPHGRLVVCAPRPNHFIFRNSRTLRPGYELIQDDPVGIRNGEVLRQFRDEVDIKQQFGTHFDQFFIGSQDAEYFGEQEHFHLIVCRRKAT